MRILLLGKFPPAQGGISAKTYWLARTLAATGISFDIITIAPPSYRTAAPATAPPDLRQRICEAEASPWFLPGGDLCTEHVITEALVLAAERAPDAIEANYLAPFGIAALVAARLLGVPLIIRHAGSDIAKLLDWPPARGALRALLGAANLVLTTPDARPRLEDLTPSRRLLALPRYAPDPAAFAWRPPISSRLLLIAGKLNYHWRLKGLDVLLEALALRPEWRVLSVVDGCGREDFDLSKTENLAVLVPIDEAGIYVDGYGDLVGKPAQKAAEEILKSLRAKDIYYKSQNYKHNYPHCWRCSTPLLFRNVDRKSVV